MKPLWPDDLPGRSLEEILQSKMENRAWNKALRHQAMLLVNSRLAKLISLEDYAMDRQQGHDDAAECKRRGTILDNEISGRDRRWLPQSSEKESFPA